MLAAEKVEFAFALVGQGIEAAKGFIDESRVAHHNAAFRQSGEKLTHQRGEIGLS